MTKDSFLFHLVKHNHSQIKSTCSFATVLGWFPLPNVFRGQVGSPHSAPWGFPGQPGWGSETIKPQLALGPRTPTWPRAGRRLRKSRWGNPTTWPNLDLADLQKCVPWSPGLEAVCASDSRTGVPHPLSREHHHQAHTQEAVLTSETLGPPRASTEQPHAPPAVSAPRPRGDPPLSISKCPSQRGGIFIRRFCRTSRGLSGQQNQRATCTSRAWSLEAQRHTGARRLGPWHTGGEGGWRTGASERAQAGQPGY